MRTIIVEDNPVDAAFLSTMLKEQVPDIEILSHCSNIRDAIQAINLQKPQLVFLDIELDDGEISFDLLKEYNPPDFHFIFITNYYNDNNILRALRASAVDFLQKPMRATDLADALLLFQKKISQQQELDALKNNLYTGNGKLKDFILANAEGSHRIEINKNLVYCKAARASTKFHLTDHEAISRSPVLVHSKNIKYWEQILKYSDMYRIHNSHMVNMNFITRIKNNTIFLKSGENLPVARDRKDDFTDCWNQFLKLL